MTSYTDRKEGKTDEHHRFGRITLLKDESKEVIPDPTHDKEHLTYASNEKIKHVYTVWDSRKIDHSDRRFLYGWKEIGIVYVIAPYYVPPSVEENSDVMCSNRLDVTKAVYSKHPTKALKKKLKQLANRSNSQKGFNKDMYHWDFIGDEESFTVGKHDTEKKEENKIPLYWKEGGTRDSGKMLLTRFEAQKVLLNFKVL